MTIELPDRWPFPTEKPGPLERIEPPKAKPKRKRSKKRPVFVPKPEDVALI